MGQIIIGSNWDLEQLKRIGVKLPAGYTVARPNAPTPRAVSSCDYKGKYTPPKRYTTSDQRAKAACAARYAQFTKKYPYYFSGIAKLVSPTMSGSQMQSLIMSGACTSGGGSSSGSSSCSSCRSRSKKQTYNRKRTKSKKSRSKPAKRNYKK